MRGFFNCLPRVCGQSNEYTLSIELHLKEVGLTLPDPPKPAGNCVPWLVRGQLDFTLRSDQERPTPLYRPGRHRTHRRSGLGRRSSRCAQRDRANPHCLRRFGSLQNASACRGPCCLRPRVKPSAKSPRWRVQALRFCAGRTRCPHARRVHSDATTREPRGRTRRCRRSRCLNRLGSEAALHFIPWLRGTGS